MIQSMSRVGRCLDNAPMEGWWGILKSEMYYLKRFTSREELVYAIEEYIRFYNTRRYQKRLNCMTPCEYYFASAVWRKSLPAAQQGEMKESIYFAISFVFLSVYLTGGILFCRKYCSNLFVLYCKSRYQMCWFCCTKFMSILYDCMIPLVFWNYYLEIISI